MGLESSLFRGDRALEACLVDDRAHLVVGTKGPHVKKVQQALAILDGALIDLGEVKAQTYGPSTAQAVLDFKSTRRIINFRYQQQPDNITGKMTIAALDKELQIRDSRPPLRGCLDETEGGGRVSESGGSTQGVGAFGISRVSLNFAIGDVAPVAEKKLRVAFQDAREENEVGIANPNRILFLSRRALELLKPHGLGLQVQLLAAFPFPKQIAERDSSDVEGIRKTAEKAAAGADNVLRVIFCQFRPTKSTATSNGRITGVDGFPNFVLMNKNKVHPDFGTLVHEMIHCASDSLMSDSEHVEDKKNIFSTGEKRTELTARQAAILRGSFFGR